MNGKFCSQSNYNGLGLGAVKTNGEQRRTRDAVKQSDVHVK
jgi:hypothetical protein